MKKIVLLAVVSILAAAAASCRREIVSFRDMSPQDQFAHAKTFYDKKDYYRAKQQFTRVMMNNPGDPVIEGTQFYLAESYFYSDEFILAIEEYQKLINSMPQSEFVDDAEYKIALCYYRLSPKYSLDQEYTAKAVSQLQYFLDEYPLSEFVGEAREKLRECRNKLGMKEFKTGELYKKMGYPRAALISFKSVIDNYYDTDVVDDALFMMGECQLLMGNLEDAELAYQRLLDDFPASHFREKAGEKLQKIREELSRYQIGK
ncbi:outer membrane protein assembly factor BamD [bacterium]|nr:outer membrane protein assembly factor BamD [bacterium]